jgi:hypothetical protein
MLGCAVFGLLCTGCLSNQADSSLVEPPISTAPSEQIATINLPAVTPESPSASIPDVIPTQNLNTTPLPAAILEMTPTPVFKANLPTGQVSDLLFLSNSDLIRWDPESDETALLLDDVERFSSSLDGSRITILRSRKIAANASRLYDLDLYEPKSGLSTTLLAGTSDIPVLSISPDGRWVAYLNPGQQNQIFISPFRNPEIPNNLIICERLTAAHCDRLLWSKDNRDLLWSDRQGLWLVHETQPARLAVPGRVQITDPQGETSEIQVAIRPISWSPAGRFALVEVIPSTTSVHWLAVADTRTGRVVEVPDTFSTTEEVIREEAIGWLKDGRLAVAAANPDFPSRFPNITLYQVIATHGELLVLDESFSLFDNDFLLGPTDHPGVTFTPLSLTQTDDQQISLALIPSENITPAALVNLDLQSGSVAIQRIVPNDLTNIIWSSTRPDAVYFGANSEVIYLPAGSTSEIDLQANFGNNLHDFYWVYSPDPS